MTDQPERCASGHPLPPARLGAPSWPLPPTDARLAGLASSDPGSEAGELCACGHVEALHLTFGGHACTVARCKCLTFRRPPDGHRLGRSRAEMAGKVLVTATALDSVSNVAATMRRLEVRIGQLLPAPAPAHRPPGNSDRDPSSGINPRTEREFRQMAEHPEVVEAVIERSSRCRQVATAPPTLPVQPLGPVAMDADSPETVWGVL